MKDLLDCMLKESFVRGVMGGGVTWELQGEGETEKRLSLDMTLRTWLFGLCGLSGLICRGTKNENPNSFPAARHTYRHALASNTTAHQR